MSVLFLGRRRRRFAASVGPFLLALAPRAQGQGAFTVLYEVPTAPGYPIVGGGGDYDGDGYDDFAVGSPLANSTTGLVRIYSGASRTLIAEYLGNAAYAMPPPFCPNPANCGERFGWSLTFMDLNADGVDEAVISAAEASASVNGVFYRLGRIAVYSQYLNGLVLGYIPAINGTQFGSLVADGGDVDADGFPDLLVSSPGFDIPGAGFFNTGAVWVLAGPIVQSTLWLVPGVQPGEGFGGNPDEGGVVGVGDADGDGHDDWAVASPSRTVGGIPFAGSVLLISGATGVLLAQWNGTSGDQFMGDGITTVGDINGDAVPDLVFSDAPLPPFNLSPQKVYVASGATGAFLYTLTSPASFGFLDRLARVGDVDGDGADEFVGRDILSTPTTFILGIKVFSGSDGTLLFNEECISCPLGFGNYLAHGGDVNGDGLGDFVVGSEGAVVGPPVGKVSIYAGRSLRVVGTPLVGGTLNLSLNVPKWPAHPYVLAFSMGNAGFVAAGYWIPLTPDALFFDSLNASITGALGPKGQGAASFPIPNFPALHGLTLYASAAVLNPGPSPAIRCILPAAKISIP